MSEREQLPESPKRPGFKEFSLLKKIVVSVLAIVSGIVIVLLLLIVNAFHYEIETLGLSILIIAAVICLPIVDVVAHRRKNRRIEFLQQILREHDIYVPPDE
jgi:hypothetical protein